MRESTHITELRRRYLEFFGERGHAIIPSASLVPANDPTVLFTTAGMHPLVPHLLGEPHPAGARLANAQRCIRTGDIDEVGDDTHLTMFEMLGNWSLGDYAPGEAIRWSFELLTGPLNLPLARLGATCFAGDEAVPRDDASVDLWQQLGLPRERIQLLGRGDNWWGPAGKTGPCGPDTEMFYWVGDGPAPAQLDVRDRRWVEIWNDVFMSYTMLADGTVQPARGNVDTGMGLERTLMALGGYRSVYEVDTMEPIARLVRDAAGGRGGERDVRIVADHMRAACMAIFDGVVPANKERGYIVRRLLRRSLVHARKLGLPADWYRGVVDAVARALGDMCPDLAGARERIVATIGDEVTRFGLTLVQAQRVLDNLVGEGNRSVLDGAAAFDLFQTFGFPFDLSAEIAEARGLPIDRASFDDALAKHRELSRTTSSGAFAGGLADHGVDVVRYHTLTHLLQAALRATLGSHVIQRGSNITRERLRFDFSHDGKPTDEQLRRVEAMVHGWLARDLVVERAIMPGTEALAIGAIGAFGEKYGDTCSVYTVSDPVTGEVISRELCGGPHVRSTRELRGTFRIVREQAVSSGVRRIKAVLEP
jgi:alanyl-tRNA synthetase